MAFRTRARAVAQRMKELSCGQAAGAASCLACPRRHQRRISGRMTPCTDHRTIDRPPAPRTQANSPPEEREVSVPCHRWVPRTPYPYSLSRACTGLLTATGSHAPLNHGRGLHARRGSASLPLSPMVLVYFPGISRSILPHTTHHQPILPFAKCSTVYGRWALHSIQPCVGGAVIFLASSSTGAPL